MKALTVQQPWAWAIIHGGKSPENRVTGIVGTYRGPLAIHAGLRVDDDAYGNPLILEALGRCRDDWLLEEAFGRVGAIIGVVDLVNEHGSPPGSLCCGRWAEPGRHHINVVNPRPLDDPIPCRGALGLWTPPADVLEQLQAVAA